MVSTHAITIQAPPKDVWPWLVQIGQDRGGFYSYSRLENLVGCQMRNTNLILPQCQNPKVGDTIRFHPKAPVAPITEVDPEKTLVIGGMWSFVLRQPAPGVTRLIVRCRAKRMSPIRDFFGYRLILEPAHFVMERKMLLTIKELAERMANREAHIEWQAQSKLELPARESANAPAILLSS
jgi:hypothetical protein